jgi:hypothetical protein
MARNENARVFRRHGWLPSKNAICHAANPHASFWANARSVVKEKIIQKIPPLSYRLRDQQIRQPNVPRSYHWKLYCSPQSSATCITFRLLACAKRRGGTVKEQSYQWPLLKTSCVIILTAVHQTRKSIFQYSSANTEKLLTSTSISVTSSPWEVRPSWRCIKISKSSQSRHNYDSTRFNSYGYKETSQRLDSLHHACR